MPNVNIKYQLTLDALVVLNELKFEGHNFVPNHTDGTYNQPVDIIYVSSHIHIRMVTSGIAGSWKVAVWVIAIDGNNQPEGDWKPCDCNDKSPFTDDVNINNILSGDFLIKWV
jgi:hypothetical protein